MLNHSLKHRDGRLTHNWYVACLSSEIAKKPIKRVLYDTPIALYRDSDGIPHALLDRCLHRGAQLSLGACEKDHLQCPYHGWKYDSLGNVVEIPSEGPSFQRRDLKLRTFPCKEQDGVVWVWMGEELPKFLTPPWRFPNFGDRNWTHYFMVTDFDNEVTHLCENFMDVPHTVFVHRGWFRNRSLKKVPMKIELSRGEVNVVYEQENDSIGVTDWIINPSRNKMQHTDRFIFPNLTRVDYKFGSSSAFIINSQCTPVSTMKSRVYTYIAFHSKYMGLKLGPMLKPFMRFYTKQVILQDVEIMKNQGDNLKVFGDGPFKSTGADEIHLAIENLRKLGIQGKPDLWDIQRQSETLFWI